MKRNLFIVMMTAILSVMGTHHAFAYDFAVENADGKTIYYNYIHNDMELEVTYMANGNDFWDNHNAYQGNIVIPEKVTYMNRTRKVTRIGYGAFCYCTDLTSIIIPSRLESIGNSAFYCSGLTSITLPEGLLDIGEFAFARCFNLTSITIEGVKIPHAAFAYCASLTTVNLRDVYSIALTAFEGCSRLTSITIPDNVTSIGSGAFSGCSSLTSVTIPNWVTSIGSAAFYGCQGLTSVTIGKKVTSIGNIAFDCQNLTEVISLIKSPFSIYGKSDGNNTFNKNTFNNATLYVPAGTKEKYKKTQGWKDFLFIEEIKTVQINGINYVLIGSTAKVNSHPNKYTGSVEIPETVTYHGNRYSVTSIGDSAFWRCQDLTSITIPNSVTSIGNYAFSCCSGLTSVTIPNSVISIGDYAFSSCSCLTSITIPDNVTSIGEGAFYYCTGLTSVAIGNSVVSIGGGAFENCTGLTSITIPNSVSSIGYYAFYGCRSLTSITIPNSVTNIEYSAFSCCTGLTSLTIPNSVTSIGEGAFDGCTGITSITIPNSVISISSRAFNNCTGLTSVTIPNSLKSFGEHIFSGCDNLTKVISLIEDPYDIAGTVIVYTIIADPNSYYDWYVFDESTCEKATLYVPAGTINKYMATEGWKDFKHIEKMEEIIGVNDIEACLMLVRGEDGIISIEGAPKGIPICIYSTNGMLEGEGISYNSSAIIPTTMKPGSVAIVKIGSKSVKVVMK